MIERKTNQRSTLSTKPRIIYTARNEADGNWGVEEESPIPSSILRNRKMSTIPVKAHHFSSRKLMRIVMPRC
jgi:hypothetical protein